MKGNKRMLLALKLFSDSLMILFSWLLAGFLRFYIIPGGMTDDFFLFLKISILVLSYTLFFLSKNGLYEEDLEHSWRKETSLLVFSSFEGFLLLVITLYFLFPQKVSRLSIALYFLLLLIFLVTERTMVSGYIKSCYRNGKYTRRILLVGFGEGLQQYEKALHSNHVLGIKLVGQYDGRGNPVGGVKQLKNSSLREAVQENAPDLVVISYPPHEYDHEQSVISEGLDLLNEKVIMLPRLPESHIGTKISDFRWIPVLTLNAADINVFGRISKRLFDLVFCTLGVVLISPLLAIIALLVKITSPGPVIFKQQRVTKDEQIFTMYKFRSMRTDIPEGDVHWTEENDPRVTKIGRFLRNTSLDELPQLFNVIGGSMSLVGPRPERPELVSRFNKEIPGYRMRHRVKSGITGWAQVNGWRGNTSLNRRIEFDLFYIRNWSMVFDFKIILFTLMKGFINENAY